MMINLCETLFILSIFSIPPLWYRSEKEKKINNVVQKLQLLIPLYSL